MESIPTEFQWVGGIAFAIAIGVLAAWSKFFGKKEGPAQPKVQEFAMTGQLADMGPVKELIGSVGLVAQQMIRANMALEANAKAQETAAVALTKFAATYEHQIEDAEREREIAEEVERRLKDRRTSRTT